MNKFIQIIIVIFLVPYSMMGQNIQFLHPSQTEYTKGEDFVRTPDGGYMVAGIRSDRIALFKLDANGIMQWDRFVLDDPMSSRESVKSIVQTDDGNYVLAVTTRNTTLERGAGLIKVNPLGEVIWNKLYRSSLNFGVPSGQKMAQTADNGFIMTSNIWTIDSWPYFQRGQLFRMDNNGDTLWTRVLPNGSGHELDLIYKFNLIEDFPVPLVVFTSSFDNFVKDTISSIEAIDSLMNADDFYTNNWVYDPADSTLRGGTLSSSFSYENISLYDIEGNFFYYSTVSSENTLYLDILDVIETSSGDFMVVGKYNDKAYVARLAPNGEVIWETNYAFSEIDNGASCIVETFDGNFAIGGYLTEFTYYNHHGLIFKIDGDGNEIWDIRTSYNAGEIEVFADIIEGNDHSLIAAGHEEDFDYVVANAANSVPFMAKVSPDGNELWKIRENDAKLSFIGTLKLLDNNSYAMVGWELNFGVGSPTYSNAFLRSYDTIGHTVSNLIQGTVFFDQNEDCNLSASEDSLRQWIIEIQSNGQTVYTTSDIHGQYATLVDTGTYSVQLIPLNNYWDLCPAQTVTFTEFFSNDTLNLGTSAFVDCPYLEVDISTPFVRRCFENTYTVSYCNAGTISAEDAYIEVAMDPYFSYLSSSIPVNNQVGQVLTFNIGAINIGECGHFTITVYVDCDQTTLGQTHCMEAHIFPDELCDPELSTYPQIDIEGSCQGDSLIIFTLKNIGTENMSSASEYVVIEDHVMYFNEAPTFDLGINESESIEIIADGSTYRIQAPQLPGTIYQGNISFTIEGCGNNELGEFSIGMVTVFTDNDEEHYLSIDCQENIGAYDPNDKQSFPKGYEEERLIENNTELEYLIRFQNTGTDTAFYVEIIDTLSSNLIASSIQPGTSSHPYTWRLYDENVLKFKFDNILLPDSTVNQLGSNGFVKFKILQKPDLPNGIVINNAADIYFDFNAAVVTNTTFLTIGEDFIEIQTATNEIEFPDLNITVAPNPFSTDAIFILEGVEFKEGLLKIYNTQGQLIKEQYFSENAFDLNLVSLPSGLFYYSIELDNRLASSGKLVK